LAGQAVAKGNDVYLFLIGMMLLSELAREQGVFDWVASVGSEEREAVACVFSFWFTASALS
jgi:arsenical pump membrane protein